MKNLKLNQVNLSLIREDINAQWISSENARIWIQDQYLAICKEIEEALEKKTFFMEDENPTIDDFLSMIGDELSDAPDAYPDINPIGVIHFISTFLMDMKYYKID